MNFTELLSKEWFRLTGMLVIGITIGALFYPTKKIEERVSLKYDQEIALLKESHTKEVQELSSKLDKSEQESKQFRYESERKISTLTSQITELKLKQKITTYKLVKPDGTIEERTYTENDIDQSTKTVTKIQEEFKQKIDAIESKWSTIHQERVSIIKKDFDSKESEYKKTIYELEKTKTVTINEKRFGLEGGLLSNKDYYGHATMDMWGPIFVGVHGQMGQGSNTGLLGAGVGVRF